MSADSQARAAVQRELHAAVEALTRPVETALPDQSPPLRDTVLLPCLLDQLADALESSSSRGGAQRTPSSAPLALDVLILLEAIDRAVHRVLRADTTLAPLPSGRVAQVRAWAARSGHWRATAPAYLVYAAGLAAEWLARAQAILTPVPPTLEPRAQPCPRCGVSMVLMPLPEGDGRVQRSALYLDTERVAVICRACGDSWPTDHLGFLATLLADTAASVGTTVLPSPSHR